MVRVTLWRLKLGERYYKSEGASWAGDYETALALRWGLARTGGACYALVTDCPNHAGAYDCTPFCNICEGEQETTDNRKEGKK